MQIGAYLAQYTIVIFIILLILAIILIWKERWMIGLAFRNFKRKKVRNTLTLIGVLFSVAMLTGFNITRVNVTHSFYQTVELATGKLDLEITRADGEPFSESLMHLLDDIDGIEAYAPRIQRYCVIYVHPSWNSTMATVIGIDPKYDNEFGDLFDYNTSEPINHLVTGKNAIVSESLMDGISGEADGKIVNASVGDELAIKYYHDPPSYRVRRFNIAAFAEGKGKIAQIGYGRTVVVTLDRARDLVPRSRGKIDKIIINLSEEGRKDYKAVINQIQDEFGKDFAVQAVRETLLANAEGAIEGFDTALNWAGLITLIASIFLVFNTIVMTVAERRYELGIMRSIGMSKFQVFRLILYEVIFIGGIGAFVGSLGGVLVAHAITTYVTSTYVYGFKVVVESLEIDPSIIFSGFLMGFIFAVVGSFYPLISTTTMKPVHALHGGSYGAEKRKVPRLLLVGGVILALLGFGGLFIVPRIPSAYLSDFLSGTLFLSIVGISIVVAKFSKRAAGLTAGVGLTAAGGFITISAVSYLSEIVLLIGSIILCGALLGIVSRVFHGLLKSIPAFQTVAKLASRNLTRQPLRSTLTFGIFTICISLSILFSSINSAIEVGITHYISDNLNMDLIVTTNTGAPPTLAGNLSRIEGVHWTNDTPTGEWRPGVSIAEMTGAKFKLWDQEETSLLLAVNSSTFALAVEQSIIQPDPNTTDPITLYDQLGPGDNKCIISDRLAEKLHVKVGQKTKLGIAAHGNFTEFTVVGIVHNDLIGYPRGGYFCIIGMDQYYDFGFDEDVHVFYVKLRSHHWNGTVVDQDKVAQQILDLYGDQWNLNIIKTKDIVEEWRVNVTETTKFMAVLSSSSIIIALLCLATTMIRIVQERRRELGLLRAVGYHRAELIKLLLGESLLLAVLGLIIGIINGYTLAASYLPQFKSIGFTPYDVSFVMPWTETIIVAFLSIAVAVAATAFPAYKALKISPAEAVRYMG